MAQEPPSVRPRRRLLRWFIPALFLFVGYAGFVVARLFVFQPKLEIGRETTFVTGPVRPDGTIDFAAALNAEWSKGVTPENNAAVPLARAFGPKVIAPEIREEYFRQLGIEVPPPDEGRYFLPLKEFLDSQKVEQERQAELLKAYTEADGTVVLTIYPELVDWVERNEEPLAKVSEASRLSRYFEPAVPADPSALLLDAGLPPVANRREVARLLVLRAALRINEGDMKGACEAAVVCHQFSRLLAQHPTMIGYLVAAAVDANAAKISEAIVLSGKLTPDLASRFRTEIEALPPFPDIADILDRGERLYAIDSMCQISAAQEVAPEIQTTVGEFSKSVNANIVLREVNRFYDATIAAMRLDDRIKRMAELGRIENEYRERSRAESKAGAIVSAVILGDSGPLTRQVSLTLLSLLAPSLHQIQEAEDRAVMRTWLCRIGCVLAEHQAVEGEFPASLETMASRFPSGIPLDLYSGQPLNYRRVEGGFLLYSVGPNGRDDHGLTFGERDDAGDDCDDIRFGVAPVAADEDEA